MSDKLIIVDDVIRGNTTVTAQRVANSAMHISQLVHYLPPTITNHHLKKKHIA